MNTVKPGLLSALIQEVKVFCAARRGRVNQLASDLEINPQQVSAWLSGRFEPGGDATLRIQAWLKREKEIEAENIKAKIAAAPSRLAAAMRKAG